MAKKAKQLGGWVAGLRCGLSVDIAPPLDLHSQKGHNHLILLFFYNYF